MRVGHEAIQFRPGIFRAANTRVNVGVYCVPAASLGELLKLTGLKADILTMISCADPGVDGHSSGHRLCPFGFGPGFRITFTFRPLKMSTSVHSQSVRPFGILIAVDGLIIPRASQRLSVLNEMPIFLAACRVL